MRLLVIGGVHGDEPLGMAVLAELEKSPAPNVSTLVGNPRACEAGVRHVDADLNRVFPGDLLGGEYEVERAYELREFLEGDFDLILDFHNTITPDNDCGFIGDSGDRTAVAAAAAFLKLPRVVIANYNCVNRYAPNCLSVEVSLDSPECRADLWVARIRKLASMDAAQLNSLTLPPIFRFVGRVSPEQVEGAVTETWRAFQPVPAQDARALGLPEDAHAIFVDEKFSCGYYAALVKRAFLPVGQQDHEVRTART